MRTTKRNIKNIFFRVIDKIKIKYLSLTIAKQITLIGASLGIFSLFLPWIIDNGKKNDVWNSFNTISGNIGYILIIIFFLIFFLILSNSYKEKIKMYSGVNLTNHLIIISSGILAIILSIVAISFAVGLSIIGQFISYGNGAIFCMVAGILIFIGGIFIRLDYKKSNSDIILEEMSKNREEKNKKENMELPF